MSEYWVSKKKYFCKYCDIYIADDAPSRQQHEGGLRHKGNVERFIRGIYKAGEKKKKDMEEEKREMVRVEQAARAAFAQDITLGHAKVTSAPGAASSSSAPRKPSAKPSSPFVNYSTPEQLGFSDPDAELLNIRKTQGLVGDWQIIELSTPPLQPPEEAQNEDIKPGFGSGTEPTSESDPGGKRTAEASPEDDPRSFKLRKKTVAVGLGEVYDPDLIPIKLKKRDARPAALDVPAPTVLSTSTPTTGVPKWTAISLKPKDSLSIASPSPAPTIKLEEANGSRPPDNAKEPSPQASRWTKVQWNKAVEEGKGTTTSSRHTPSENAEPAEPPIKEEASNGSIKIEQDIPGLAPELEPSIAGLFKKRKGPVSGRGRQ